MGAMKFTVSKKFTFEAAHSLPHLPEGHKCRNVHGHSYVVELFCTGPLDEQGFVVDYADISRVANPLIDTLDHQNLNEILPFATTAENIAEWFFLHASDDLPTLSAVHVYETAKTCVRVEK